MTGTQNMRMINSEPKTVVNAELELTPAEEDELVLYAEHGIRGDRNTLLSWAVNQILKNACGEMFVARKLGVRLEDIDDESDEDGVGELPDQSR